MQDEVLIKGCMANERAAQERLYKMFYADMIRVCMRYLRTNDLAEEALNIGFLKVFQQIQTFNEKKGNLGGWIRTIMLRSCIDLGRKELRFKTDIDDIPPEEEVFIAPEALDNLYAQDLLLMIKSLPDASQMVFNLSVLEGYTHKEISEQLQITESTSRWHLSAAKKQLRGLLDPKGSIK